MVRTPVVDLVMAAPLLIWATFWRVPLWRLRLVIRLPAMPRLWILQIKGAAVEGDVPGTAAGFEIDAGGDGAAGDVEDAGLSSGRGGTVSEDDAVVDYEGASAADVHVAGGVGGGGGALLSEYQVIDVNSALVKGEDADGGAGAGGILPSPRVRVLIMALTEPSEPPLAAVKSTRPVVVELGAAGVLGVIADGEVSDAADAVSGRG